MKKGSAQTKASGGDGSQTHEDRKAKRTQPSETRGSSSSRKIAVQILARVLSNGEALDEVLERAARERVLSTSERAWLLEICAGTLRWKGRLDLILDQLCVKKKPTGDLRRSLLIGAYQLLGQSRTSPGAVVSETVEFIKSREGRAPAQFANAILRKVAQQVSIWEQWQIEPGTPAGEQAAWASLPSWFWKRLVDQRGFEWARDYAFSAMERPELWLHSRTRIPLLALNENESATWLDEVPGACRVSVKRPLDSLPGFAEGEFFVQDISSQKLISESVAALGNRYDGRTIQALDYCAAPGGKAIGLAWKGMDVVATDISERRLPLLRENVLRLGQGKVQVVPIRDVTSDKKFDWVWVDAPCSGSGIIRRHPDVRWLRKESDLEKLCAQQTQILEKIWDSVRPGGFLLYSVCSVFQEEGFESRMPRDWAGKFKIHRQWLLAPHLPPGGDGFQATLLEKVLD